MSEFAVVTGTPDIVYEDDTLVIERRQLRPDDSTQIPYLITRPHSGELQPLVWEKGYSNGCDDKVPLARAFARHGYGMLAVGQNRKGVLMRDPRTGYPDAIGTQAETTLAVVESEGLNHETLPLVGYSMGGSVAAAMIQKAREKQWPCFDEADVVLLAPPGIIPKDSLARLSLRGAHDIIMQRLRTGLASSSELLVADGRAPTDLLPLLLQNPLLAAREGYETANRRIKLANLARSVGWLSVGVFAGDRMVPARITDRSLEIFFNDPSMPHNVSYFVPYSTDLIEGTDRVLGTGHAGHLDPFLYPARVAGATVSQLHRQELATAA